MPVKGKVLHLHVLQVYARLSPSEEGTQKHL